MILHDMPNFVGEKARNHIRIPSTILNQTDRQKHIAARQGHSVGLR